MEPEGLAKAIEAALPAYESNWVEDDPGVAVAAAIRAAAPVIVEEYAAQVATLTAERDALARDLDTSRAVAQGNKRHAAFLFEETEKLRAELAERTQERDAARVAAKEAIDHALGLAEAQLVVIDARDAALADAARMRLVVEAAEVRAQVIRDGYEFGHGASGWSQRDRDSDDAIVASVERYQRPADPARLVVDTRAEHPNTTGEDTVSEPDRLTVEDVEVLKASGWITVSAEPPERQAQRDTPASPSQQPVPAEQPDTGAQGTDEERHPEAYCHRCGGPNLSWSAPSPLWNQVMRGGDINGPWEFDEIICPVCFAQLAEKRGVASFWYLSARRVHVPLQLVTPSGRVWDEDQCLWVDPAPQGTDAVQDRTGALEAAIEAALTVLPAVSWRGRHDGQHIVDRAAVAEMTRSAVRAAAPHIQREALLAAALDLQSAHDGYSDRHPVDTGYRAGLRAAWEYLRDAASSLIPDPAGSQDETGEGERG